VLIGIMPLNLSVSSFSDFFLASKVLVLESGLPLEQEFGEKDLPD